MGRSLHAESLLRASPQEGATDGGASEHPGPTVDRLVALESLDLLHDTAVPPSIAIFIRGGERNS
jgi:hypothetical protein